MPAPTLLPLWLSECLQLNRFSFSYNIVPLSFISVASSHLSSWSNRINIRTVVLSEEMKRSSSTLSFCLGWTLHRSVSTLEDGLAAPFISPTICRKKPLVCVKLWKPHAAVVCDAKPQWTIVFLNADIEYETCLLLFL